MEGKTVGISHTFVTGFVSHGHIFIVSDLGHSV